MKKEKIESNKAGKEIKLNNLFNKSNYRLFAIILLLAGGLFGYYWFGSVAVVNGQPISRFKYIKNMEEQVGKQVLEQMINEALILGEADKKGVKIEQGEIDSEIVKIDEQIKAQGQTLESILSLQGMGRSDLEKQIRMQKLIEKMSSPNTEISEEKIQEFLTANKELLPKDATKEELHNLAKEQLTSQAASEAMDGWLSGLRDSAKIIYR